MSELPPILQRVKDKGYAVFTNGDWNLNIVGVRSRSRVANAFDDELYLVFKKNDEWVTLDFKITTDPGQYHLDNPSRVEGTAILKAGQYRGVYRIDKHRGKYEALCQREGKVTVWRDSNRDATIDFEPESQMTGYYGINIHRSTTRDAGSSTVDRYSAGCQVFSYPREFDVFMSICHVSALIYGNKFTYTLLED